ncbi:MAG: hypothetical protein Q8L23_15440 [Caulobacter sp.]|nr:hypothetical protein [Caulobacter sp.]
MMRLAALLAVALLVAGPARAAPPAFPVGEVRSLSLNAAGEVVVTVKPGRRAVLEADVFAAPDAAGDITLEVLDKAGHPLPSGLAAGPGPVTVRIKAANPGAATIQIRVRADPSVDGFEPNDSKDRARPATVPFSGWIEMGPGDQDWFRIDAPADGVVGVGLNPPSNGRLRFLDERGAVIQETAEDGYVAEGITYVAARGRRMYIIIEGPESGPRFVSRLTISRYAKPGGQDGALVTVGLADQDETVNQLNLAAQAAGARTLSAEDADTISSALTEALAEPAKAPARTPWLLAIGAALLIAAGGGGYWWWRKRKAPVAKPADPEEQADTPEPPDPAP